MIDIIADRVGVDTRLLDRLAVDQPGGTWNWWRVGASASIVLTGLALLIPNVAPLVAGTGGPLGLVLAALGTLVTVGLVAAGAGLYYSGFSATNAVRIAAWNLLGVVVLGAVMAVHVVHEAQIGPGLVSPAFTVGNVVAIGAAAHVIIGFYDARRVRAEQLARERRKLAVLNRVLRHNLRNEATVMLGHAENLLDELDADSPLRPSAEKIHEKAGEVGGLADDTKQIMAAVERRSEPARPIEVGAALDRVAGRIREAYPAATVTVEAPEDLWIWADDGFEVGVEQLAENAVVHNDRESPTVRLEAAVDDRTGRVKTTVSDDGPGIPEHERSVVSGDAEITQLTHGSGLGLWVARQTADACDATLEFAEREDRGSSVSFAHHRCERRPA